MSKATGETRAGQTRTGAPDMARVGAARRAMLLVNRNARSGAAALDRALAVLGAAGIAIEAEQAPADPAALADAIAAAAAAGIDTLIVGGGDGTLNAVARPLADTGLTLGILPLGTANDFARTLAIPADVEAAAEVIAAGRVRAVDLGEVNGVPFFNVATIGFGARLADELDGAAKARWGVLGYAITACRALSRMRPFTAELAWDGERQRIRTVQVSVGNGRHYGGGMTVDENARPDDGLLHVYSLEIRRPWQLMTLVPALRRGTHHRSPDVRAFSCTGLEVATRRPKRVNTDGEITTRTPARFGVLRDAIRVYAPADGEAAADGDG